MGFIKFERGIPEDPAERTFGGFKRGPDGKFSDDDLVNCISDAIEDVAGAFGSRNVPKALKPVEIMGILQGRKWNVAGLNEFRKHFGLKPYETFEDINSDPDVSGALKHLYGHPDFVELYPGLVAEEAKAPMAPGVGIAVRSFSNPHFSRTQVERSLLLICHDIYSPRTPSPVSFSRTPSA